MKTHSNARLTPLGRAEMIRRIRQEQQPVAQVAKDFGVAERTAYKWLARFRVQGLAGLHDRSSRPPCSPRTTHPLRVARVLALRRRRLPGFQIARAAHLSKACVSRLLRGHRARLARLDPPPPIRRYERAAPGELIHFDMKKLARIERPGHRVTGDRQNDHVRGAGWEHLHNAIDDHGCSSSLRSALRAKRKRCRVAHSRLAFAQLWPDETTSSALGFLRAALAFFRRHGVEPQRLYSDNGSAYRSHLMRATATALGLKQRFTKPYSPKTNGKAERFIQTSLREWAYAHAYAHCDQPAARPQHFLHNYNWHRPHHALKLQAPVSRLRQTLNNLLSLHS